MSDWLNKIDTLDKARAEHQRLMRDDDLGGESERRLLAKWPQAAKTPTLDASALLARATRFTFCNGIVLVEATLPLPDAGGYILGRNPDWVIRVGTSLLGTDGRFRSSAPRLRMDRDTAVARALAMEDCYQKGKRKVAGLCPTCGLHGCIWGAR